MRLGITIPVVSNVDGAFSAINSMRSREHVLHFYIVNNCHVDRSVAASWNLGCEALFGEDVPAVVIANDDILCSPSTLDGLVECWVETGAALVSGVDRNESMSPEEMKVYSPRRPHQTGTWPDFALFLLPKQTWELVGRFDENFLGIYFEDDDYQARGALLELAFVSTTGAPFYHFGGMTQRGDRAIGDEQFEQNRQYFISKWADHTTSGDPAEMRRRYWPTPFNDPRLTVRDCPPIRYKPTS